MCAVGFLKELEELMRNLSDWRSCLKLLTPVKNICKDSFSFRLYFMSEWWAFLSIYQNVLGLDGIYHLSF